MRATRRTRLGGAGDPDSLSPPAESHWEWDAPHSRRKALIPGPVLLMTAHRAMRDVKIPTINRQRPIRIRHRDTLDVVAAPLDQGLALPRLPAPSVR